MGAAMVEREGEGYFAVYQPVSDFFIGPNVLPTDMK